MIKIIDKRVCPEMKSGFVVFLNGMRVNKPWKIRKWLPMANAMPRMLVELAKHPELGLLHAETQFSFPNVTVTQYWKSFEALEAYTKARDHAQLPAWQAFNKAWRLTATSASGTTYVIEPGRFENIYNNMPPYGLGAVGEIVDAVGARQAARQRVKAKVA